MIFETLAVGIFAMTIIVVFSIILIGIIEFAANYMTEMQRAWVIGILLFLLFSYLLGLSITGHP